MAGGRKRTPDKVIECPRKTPVAGRQTAKAEPRTGDAGAPGLSHGPGKPDQPKPGTPGPCAFFRREKDLQRAVRHATCERVLWFRNNRGVADYGNRKVVYGLGRGGSDLIGVVRDTGRFIACETKSRHDKPTEDQKLFIRSVQLAGGIGVVAWTVQDVLDALDENASA